MRLDRLIRVYQIIFLVLTLLVKNIYYIVSRLFWSFCTICKTFHIDSASHFCHAIFIIILRQTLLLKWHKQLLRALFSVPTTLTCLYIFCYPQKLASFQVSGRVLGFYLSLKDNFFFILVASTACIHRTKCHFLFQFLLLMTRIVS